MYMYMHTTLHACKYVYVYYRQLNKSLMYICEVTVVYELQEKDDVLTQLRTLERKDRAHRQKSLAKMPVSNE